MYLLSLTKEERPCREADGEYDAHHVLDIWTIKVCGWTVFEYIKKREL